MFAVCLVTFLTVCAAKTAQAEALTADQKKTRRIRSHLSGMQAHIGSRKSSRLFIPSLWHFLNKLYANNQDWFWARIAIVRFAYNTHTYF
jgi:hypothetical protein